MNILVGCCTCSFVVRKPSHKVGWIYLHELDSVSWSLHRCLSSWQSCTTSTWTLGRSRRPSWSPSACCWSSRWRARTPRPPRVWNGRSRSVGTRGRVLDAFLELRWSGWNWGEDRERRKSPKKRCFKGNKQHGWCKYGGHTIDKAKPKTTNDKLVKFHNLDTV